MDSENNKTVHINTFSGGMNTDLADSVIKPDLYRLANNVRFITDTDVNTGEMHSIAGSTLLWLFDGDIILSYNIDKYGIFFVKKDDSIKIYRVELSQNKTEIELNPVLIFGPCLDWEIKNKLSIVGRVESDDNIKLYIADGEHLILILDVLSKVTKTSINDIITNSNLILKAPILLEITSGSLKSGMNLYSYLLYSKYKQSSEISPLTKLIPIVKLNQNKTYSGIKLGVNTNIGIKIQIPFLHSDVYDTIKIYKIHYDKVGYSPEIQVIYEGLYYDNFVYLDNNNKYLSSVSIEEYNASSGIHIIPKIIELKNDYLFAAQIKEINRSESLFKDINTVSVRFTLQTDNQNAQVGIFDYQTKKNVAEGKTINDLKGIDGSWQYFDDITKDCDCFNPANDVYNLLDSEKYLFTAPDAEGNLYYGGTGKHIDWKFVVTEVVGDANTSIPDFVYGTFGTRYNAINEYKPGYSIRTSAYKYYINQDGDLKLLYPLELNGNNNSYTYTDPIVSYNLKSLRRGELYRYGIIFTDTHGNKSSVKWIADIRVPQLFNEGFETFICNRNGSELVVRPIGIEFTLHNLDGYNISQYEIVRCQRTSNDISIVSQGVISRPIKRRFSDNTNKPIQSYTPSGFLMSNRFLITENYESVLTSESLDDRYEADNFSNSLLYLFVSPELSYLSQSTLDILKTSNISVTSLSYLFSARNRDKYEQPIEGQSLQSYYINNNKFHINVTKDSNTLNYTTVVPYNNNTEIIRRKLRLNEDGYAINSSIYVLYNSWSLLYALFSNKLVDNYSLNLPNISGKNIKTIHVNSFDQLIKYNYLYFKLYNQSTQIVHRLHYKGSCDVDGYEYYENSNIKYSGYPILHGSAINQCEITDVELCKGLNWDDFAKTDTANNKVNLNYSNQILSIGTFNFCNWVCYQYYGENVDFLNDDRAAINGAGGSCLLFTINNSWKDTLNNTKENSEAFLFTDTVGANCVKTFVNNSSIVNSNDHNNPILIEYKDELSTQLFYSKDIIPESLFGTFLCNITREVVPYGGYSKNAIESSIYYSYSDVVEYKKYSDNSIVVFDGDTYIQPFEYTSMHKYYSNHIKTPYSACVTYSIPVETNINLAYTDGYLFSRNLSDNISYIQEQPSTILDIYTQQEPQYVYNTAYSCESLINPSSSLLSLTKKQDDILNYRCRYSNKKENNELLDSWSIFMPANYIDVNPNYGKITQLRLFNNQLVFFLERSFGIFSVNERTAITDDTNLPLILGSGGVLDRYDYISTSNGMKDGEFVDTLSDLYLYWWDHDNHEICAYNGQQSFQNISKTKGVQNLINKYYKENKLSDTPSVYYDRYFNEVMFNISTENEDHISGSLVYTEYLQLFTALYNINPTSGILFYNKLYLTQDGNIYSWNSCLKDSNKFGFNKPLIPYIKFVVNDNPSIVKVFDNSKLYGYFDDKDNLTFEFNTRQLHSDTIGKYASNRYYELRLAIPRDKKQPSKYGNRMRGKTMEYSISQTNSEDYFLLQSVITKYRILWS